jgi:hypothetical protein
MEFRKTFIITHNLKVELINVKLDTRILITAETSSGKEQVFMDIDRWSEFKKAINDIDKEFYKRFNYQYPNL